MFLFPKKARFTKSFSGNKLVIKNPKISYNIKNKYSGISLIATESGKVTNFQMEAVRRFLRRFLKKKAQLFFRVFPNVPITKKPNDVRQGRGKGNVKYWASIVKKGDVLVEVRGFDTVLIEGVLSATRVKFSLRTHVYNRQKRWIL